MEQQPVVFVIDYDPEARKEIKSLVNSVGLRFEGFSSPEDFLNDYDPFQSGCLVAEIRIPNMSGLDLQDELNKRGAILPVIFLTAYGNIPASVRALKAGAFDFLEKPQQDQNLLDTIQKAIRKNEKDQIAVQHRRELQEKRSLLSGKEIDIIRMIADSQPNKTIAYKINLSEKTIEYHRAKIMKTLELHSVQELTKFVLEAGIA